jgi:hypothetical protein
MAGESESEKDVKALIEATGGMARELVKKTPYDDFVEGVASRDIALAQGAKVEDVARIFQTEDIDGSRTVHIAGEGRVVHHLGDTLERGGYHVQEWHIKRPADVAKEKEKVGPALRDLLESLPVPIKDTLPEFLGKLVGLPFKAGDAVKELAEGLGPFNKEGEKESGGTE